MFRFHSQRAVAVATIFTLAACGGGGGGSVTPHTTPTPTATATPPAAAGTTATVTFTTWASQPLPTNLAYEVNGGTWKATTLPRTTLAGGTLSIPLPAGATSYGFALACPSYEGSAFQQVYELSPKDTTAVTNVGCQEDYAPQDVTAVYDSTGIASATGGTVQIAAAGYNNQENYFTNVAGTVGIDYGPATADVMQTATKSGIAIAMHLLRAQTLTPGESLNLPAMTAGDATNNTETLTASGAGYEGTRATTSYQTADGATFYNGSATGNVAIPQIAGAQAMPGDAYGLTATGVLSATQDSGTTEIITANPTSQTITAPPVWTYTAPTASDTPAFPVNYSGFSVSGFGYDQITSDNSLGGQTTFVVSKTVAGTAATLSTPNLSALAGFFNPAPSGLFGWQITLVQSNATSWVTPGTNFPVGSEIQTQSISGSFTAP